MRWQFELKESLVGKESPFWEMVVTVAPLLALTIIVEFRSIRWKLVGVGLKIALVFYMFSSISLLGAAMLFSLTKLLWWGQDISWERPWDAPLVMSAIIYAVIGVMLVPVALTVFAAMGPWMNAPYVSLRLDWITRERLYRERNRELIRIHHETRLELSERVISNKGPLFVAAPLGKSPQIADSRTENLLRESRALAGSIAKHDADHHKWRKKIKRKLRKAHDSHPVQSTSDVMLLFSK